MATPYKRYQCNQWPQYRIRDLKFVDGILTVYSKKEAELVESTDNFGWAIWEIALEQETTKVQSETAHQGMQATEAAEVAPEVEETKPETEIEEPAEDGDLVVMGGGFYEYKGVRYRGKKNLPPEAQALV